MLVRSFSQLLDVLEFQFDSTDVLFIKQLIISQKKIIHNEEIVNTWFGTLLAPIHWSIHDVADFLIRDFLLEVFEDLSAFGRQYGVTVLNLFFHKISTDQTQNTIITSFTRR